MIETTRVLFEALAVLIAFNIGREYAAWQIDRMLNGFITFAISNEPLDDEDLEVYEQDEAD